MKRLLWILLLVALPALSQVRVDQPLLTTGPNVITPTGALPQMLGLANAQVSVCNYPANGIPCSNFATTYTDGTGATQCPSNAQMTLPGTSMCTASAGSKGQFGVWVNAGTYQYTVSSLQGTYGPFTFTAGGSGGASLPTNAVVYGLSSSTSRAATGSDLNTLIQTLSGCSTAGYVYSPESGTCVAQSGGGGTVVANEFILSGAGSQNFTTNLNSLYPAWSCITKSGAQWGPSSVTPVDANDVSFTSAGATDTVCSFSAGGILNPDFLFTVTPSSLTYVPTMSGTQTPTFAIAQTGTGGYSGTATYSCTSLASGMSCGYSPTTITGTGSNTLSLSFPSTQASGLTTFNASATDGTHTHANPVAITIADTNLDLTSGWPIDEATGTTYNSAVSSNNFTAQNITWTTVSGFPAKMAFYSGSSTSNATAANQTLTNFTGTTPFSVSFWMVDNTAACTEASPVTTLDPSNNFVGWEVGTGCTAGSSNLFFFLVNTYPSNAIAVESAPTTNIRDGNLHHVCVSYASGQKAADVSFYIDGVLQTNQSPVEDTLSSSAANTKPIVLGSRSDGTQPMTGGVGFLRLYTRALGSDCTTLYAAGPK